MMLFIRAIETWMKILKKKCPRGQKIAPKQNLRVKNKAKGSRRHHPWQLSSQSSQKEELKGL